MNDECAVEGCEKEGKSRICFYDREYHHHGRIHYDCGYPKHSVRFRKNGWYKICDEHYALLKKEREIWENQKRMIVRKG